MTKYNKKKKENKTKKRKKKSSPVSFLYTVRTNWIIKLHFLWVAIKMNTINMPSYVTHTNAYTHYFSTRAWSRFSSICRCWTSPGIFIVVQKERERCGKASKVSYFPNQDNLPKGNYTRDIQRTIKWNASKSTRRHICANPRKEKATIHTEFKATYRYYLNNFIYFMKIFVHFNSLHYITQNALKN